MTITLKQAGALGGTKRWKGKTKKERSEAMRQVAIAGHAKRRAQDSTRSATDSNISPKENGDKSTTITKEDGI